MLKRVMLFACIAIIAIACKEDKEELDIRGITVTDNKGAISKTDPDDWRETNIIKDLGLSPNPFGSNSNTQLRFTILRAAHCKVWIVNGHDYYRLLVDENMRAGAYAIVINGNSRPGMYRIFVQADDEMTYGDAQSKGY